MKTCDACGEEYADNERKCPECEQRRLDTSRKNARRLLAESNEERTQRRRRRSK